MPTFKKPYIFKLISENIDCSYDGDIPLQSSPLRLSPADVQLATSIINGTCNFNIPCVYVSAKNDNSSAVNAESLAKHLFGMAHVILEPNRAFSFSLQSETDGRNAYNGAIGIYFPKGDGHFIILQNRKNTDRHSTQVYISQKIREALSLQQTPEDCTFTHVADIFSKNKILQLKSETSNELEEYIKTFDNDIKEKETEIKRLESENYDLRRRLLIQQPTNEGHDEDPLLYYGNIKDLYQGEIQDIVLEQIEKSIKDAVIGSRRRHVLQSILDNNPINGRRKQIAAEVKRIFKDYKTPTPALKSELNKIGFTISEAGKHHKLHYADNNEYFSTLPSTGSDNRGGRNCAAEAIKKLL